MMYRTAFCFTGFLSIFLVSCLLCADENRTWRDSTGRFSVEASLYQLEKDSVKLKKTDGKIVTLPITQLSADDQRYVEDLAKQNPFEGGDAVDETAVGETKERTDERTLSFSEQKVQTVDLSQVREVGAPASDTWSCVPDPAPQQEYARQAARWTFRFQDLPVQPRHADFFVDSAGKKALSLFHITGDSTNKEPDKNFTRFFVGHSETGLSISFDSPQKLQPLGFSPDGKRFIFHQKEWGYSTTGKQTLLHIADVDSGWTAAKTFEPFHSLKRPEPFSSDADIYAAAWTDNEHILVQSENGVTILLNIGTGKALWQTQTERRSGITVSPSGKYVFLSIGNQTVLRETLTGKAVGSISDTLLQQFRFSPNGQRFATCTEQGIILGDAASGALDSPFFVTGTYRGQHFFWLDNRFLFFGGDVIDTVTKTAVWRYIGLRDNVKSVGGYCWCFFDRYQEGASLVAVTIPHTQRMIPDAAEKAELAVQPGTKVSVVLEPSLSKEREEIRESVEKKIADNGWVTSDAAQISIVLKIEEEKSDKAEYSTARPPFSLSVPPLFRQEGTAIQFKPERYHISVLQDGKMLWNDTYLTTPPKRIDLDEVKETSLQKVVDKAMEEQSYKKWLEDVTIPQRISRPLEKKGISSVTENGIEDRR